MIFELPWPPSMNHYWRSPSSGRLAGRHMISEAGRKFRKDAIAAVVLQGRPKKPLSGRVWVRINVFPPDRRRRDLDNLLKPVLDALSHAGVLEDDSQIDDLRIVRGMVCPGGSLSLIVEQLP